MRLLIKSAWGSADPTQAAFPFHHANAFAEAGHEVQTGTRNARIAAAQRDRTAARRQPSVAWTPRSERP